MKATIFDIKRFAIHDGEGIRTTVFFKGCPLHCIWCHNPESIYGGADIWVVQEECIHCNKCLDCPEKVIAIDSDGIVQIDKDRCTFCNFCVDICPSNCILRIDKKVTTEDIIAEVLKDKMYYDLSFGGVTLSGGEPFAQKAFLLDLLKRLKALGISTCVETSMYCDIGTLKEAVSYVDRFYVDIKLFDDVQHVKYVGKSNVRIHENFRFLAKHAKEIIVRVPLIPGITATKKNLTQTARFVKQVNKDIPIELLNYNRLGHIKYQRLGQKCLCDTFYPFSADKLETFNNIVKQELG